MTEREAIEELKYDCNELGKAIPCDTSWGSSFESAYRMAIQANAIDAAGSMTCRLNTARR